VSTPFNDGSAGADTGMVTIFAIESDCDGDGEGPWHDCTDAEPDLWSAPSECRDFAFALDTVTMTWDPPLEPGNASGSVVYDALRSSDSSDFGSAGCIESNDNDRTVDDLSTPGPGIIWYYLVRAENDCGNGNLGAWGEPPDGLYPREARSCP
jgi:hypothetical protein